MSLKSFSLTAFSILLITILPSAPSLLGQSVLSNGDVYKMEINETGVYRFGFDLLNPILNGRNPNSIAFYSTSGYSLDEEIIEPLQSYLRECHVISHGLDDDKLDPGDYILIYLESTEATDLKDDRWTYRNNIYANSNYVFINIDESNQLKQITASIPSSEAKSIQFAQKIEHYEVDEVNILKESFDRREYGSGQEWYRKPINGFSSIDLSDKFSLTNFLPNQEVETSIAFAARSSAPSSGKLTLENQSYDFSFPSLATNDNLSTYARRKETIQTLFLDKKPTKINVSYSATNSEARGWLDWLELRYNATLKVGDKIEHYYVQPDTSTLRLVVDSFNDNTEIWDVTDPQTPKNCLVGSDFLLNGREYVSKIIVFDKSKALTPSALSKIQNQDLLDFDKVEYFIVYYDEFEEAAKSLKNHRKSLDPELKVEAISTSLIFNEFGSGKSDPSAIRNFLAYHYNKDETLQSVLLMGDGTFDCRYIYDELPKHNFIPVYQTHSSLNPINSYPSDDYFGLIDIGEGGSLRGALDIAIGRLPVKTASEAMSSVQKIISYELTDNDDSNWTSKVAFVADDEDNNLHLNSAERIANTFIKNHPAYTAKKIYTDAYPQEYTTSGEKNPLSTEAINEAINDGVLAMCYLGHGGSEGWADEQILQKTDISSWINKDKLPLLITATCSFAGYDKPSNLSAGEMVLLKEDGGCAALMTTVRVVTAQDNERLTNAVFEQLLTVDNGRVIPLGEVLRRAKNSNRSDTLQSNARKFTLLGDPMMRLKVPTYSVQIDELTNENGAALDTIKALDFLSISGKIIKPNGSVASDFSGNLDVELLDKPTDLRTLGQDAKSRVQEFEVQNQALFTGRTKVKNGTFEIKFYVPKDINYKFGQGKFVLTSLVNQHLALGTKEINIGGTNTSAEIDNTGPTITINLQNPIGPNNKSNANPIFDIYLEDASGINVSSSAIGHDITAEIDGDSKNKIVLNKQFRTLQNSYTKGTIELQLSDLTSGSHTLSIKAWDSYNNVSTSQINFEVVSELGSNSFPLLAYPNPYSNFVTLEFDNPFGLEPYKYDLFIYDGAGKLIYQKSGDNQNGSNKSIITFNSYDSPETKAILNQIMYANVIVRPTKSSQTNNIKKGVVTISRIKK